VAGKFVFDQWSKSQKESFGRNNDLADKAQAESEMYKISLEQSEGVIQSVKRENDYYQK
jgi:hypothetical protein